MRTIKLQGSDKVTIRRFLITGGPGAGKTESRAVIQKAFESIGVTVLFVPESASELIAGGVSAQSLGSDEKYQLLQLRLQMEKEEIFGQASKWMQEKPVVLVFDRGVLDGEAYMEPAAFRKLLEKEGLERRKLLARYDAVFHMQSMACLDPDQYSRDNNPARLFEARDAARQDQALLKVYAGHFSHWMIPACENMNEKLRLLADQMVSCWKILEGKDE